MGHTRAVERVVLVGKPDCHLCQDARAIVESVCAELGMEWREVSILDDPDLADRYWEQIPVVLVDGEVVATWYVDPAGLCRRLSTDNRT